MTLKILIVEDDPFIAMDLEDTFVAEGYHVLGPVAAVDKGLEILRQSKPDVAMLDYNLGRDTSIKIAQVLQKQLIPFVFLSGQIERVVIDQNIPERQVIAKPFVPAHLISVVKNLTN